MSLTPKSLIHLQSKYSAHKYWAWQHRQVSWGFLPDYGSPQPPRSGCWFSTTKQQNYQALGHLAVDKAVGAGLLNVQQRAGRCTIESSICGGRNLKLQLGLGSCLRLGVPGTQEDAAEATRNCSFPAGSSSTLRRVRRRAKATQHLSGNTAADTVQCLSQAGRSCLDHLRGKNDQPEISYLKCLQEKAH